MKKLFATILVCGLLAVSLAQAAKPAGHGRAKQHKAAQKARKAQKKHGAARGAARRAKVHSAAN
jgi:Ni/Co efflux regulator RcnB